MNAQCLLLREDQIPAGAKVQVVKDGTTEPITDAQGVPLPPLTCMYGGVPTRRKLYSLTELQAKSTQLKSGAGVKYNHMSAGLEGFKPEVRFRPVEVFSVQDAPTGRKFAVFVDGEWITYKNLPTPQKSDYGVIVKRDDAGRLLSRDYTSAVVRDRPIDLPASAQLIAISEAA